ncbi:uncharacterized protein LOC126373477 [Pectinophora gossypiella]|uniref:uncharacterized protein LOC126370432 n=1 Tax=Pectinophora gossypiella TaxID=13191 RepID=UPI00214EE4D2|nr:uncharacterized protein LOC126370432 [Pectinophora gossypiella]XP_049875591.1 uncharacterized protein LOC126373477 [Pectinophora gossypiella]
MVPKKKKLSREELLQKKREAEKLRYLKRKNDPQKREEMREKEKLKYQKKKEKGLRKLVKDMTPREHRAALKKWKEHCTVYRAKRLRLKSVTNTFLRENTPLSDPEVDTPPSRSTTPVPVQISPAPSLAVSIASRQQRKKEASKRRKKYNRERNEKIANLEKQIEKYKKRLARFKSKIKKNVEDTPKTKIFKMLDEPDQRKEVVKKALFGDVISEQLKENYSTLKRTKERQIFKKVVEGSIVQKYRHWIPKDIKLLSRNGKKANFSGLDVPLARRCKIPESYKRAVQNFFEDDSNSRMAAGKKEFISRNTVRKQKRYLLDTVFNLYKKFKTGNIKLSYQTFCRLRPFWVVKPNTQNRDTCLCVVHTNVDMKLSALHTANILTYNNHQKLLEEICCDRYDVDCLARSCHTCRDKNPKYKEFDDGTVVKYKMWVCERQQIQDFTTKKPRIVTKYLIKTFALHPRQLITCLQEDLQKFLNHQRNIVHQYKAINDLKANLQDDEVLIHVDFSENYCTKYAAEIQAFHFGGSRAQLSLHTVVIYQQNSIRSFCTVSENIAHSPAAIWTHLRPIFEALPRGVKRVHFLSDGPVTQYRNKTMFFIMATKLSEEIPDIEKFTWNYTESGHGKGAPDGIGATCKRTADFVVNSGGDINNIDQFVKVIQERCPSITCIAIDGKDIQAMIDKVEEEASDQKSFKGTLDVHQVAGVYSSSNLGLPTKCKMLTMKSLSCFCNNASCDHYQIGSINFALNPRWTVEEVFTESEPEDLESAEGELASLPNKSPKRLDEDIAGPSGYQNSCYNTGEYVLVKFPAKNVEYRYAAVINDIDGDENDLRVTFLKVCNKKVQTFRIDDKDISDVSFDQVIQKLDSPDLILKGKRIYYKFSTEVDVFER